MTVIHYHGTPISGTATVNAKALRGRHAFVSYGSWKKFPVEVVLELCQSFALDNGAFGAWIAGKPILDWKPFYEWAGAMLQHPACDFACIPDVIDGSEEDNDRLVKEWPFGACGAPVWHLHESIGRLQRLADEWPRVCLGSSGAYAKIGTPAWWGRMTDALDAITDKDGIPFTRLHGLRMLDPKVFTRIPFASADSTNVARNAGIEKKWKGTYQPPSVEWRAVILAERIEAQNAPARWERPAVPDLE